jgi:hypothetical protein
MNDSTSNCQSLTNFRAQIYDAFTKAADSLMNTADALLTENQAQSLPELSLSPFFTRKWHSLYEAFQDGRIDTDKLRHAFAQNAPMATNTRICLATDASSIARPKSKTAADRTLVHESNLPEGCPPVVAGWQFSTLALLPQTPSSWTYTLEATRIASHQKTAYVAAEQLRKVVPLLNNHTGLPLLLLADGYYSCVEFLKQTQDIVCDKLIRLAKNRLLYRKAPPRTNKPGRPKEHGEPFKGDKPSTHGPPDASFQEGNIHISCWNNLHFKEAPHLELTVIQVIRASASDTKRDPRISWFVFSGQELPSLGEVPTLYSGRYSIEHGYRVDKQDLLWENVRLRTPEQFERFTQVVACVRNQLCLARTLGCIRQPWERRSGESTPSQVRRALRSILMELGTPARVCQVRGKSPGRAKGAKISPATRYAVIRKSPKKVKPGQKLVQT